MTRRQTIPNWIALIACCLVVTAADARQRSIPEIGSTPDANVTPVQAEGVDVVENLGAQVPLDLTFIDAAGKPVVLGGYFNQDKPVVLALVYYDCPVVCAVVMGQLTEAFKGMDFAIGEDYTVVFASIDPTEASPLAASIKARYLAAYDRPGTKGLADSWAFLTTPNESTRTLAATLGWNYKPIAGGEYSHPVCIFLLTPEGRVARYVYGVGYEPVTMRMALLEASSGEISPSIGDKIRMFCYRYDPTTGKYAIVALRVVQLGGLASMLTLGALVGVLLTKERIRNRRALATKAAPATDALNTTSHAAAGPTS